VVSAGSTVYFTLTGNVAPGSNNSWTVTATLNGDSAYPSLNQGALYASYIPSPNMPLLASTTAPGIAASKFIWSPNSTSTAATTDNAWTNGYGIPGLPSTGL
jgi:hypothetical protein